MMRKLLMATYAVVLAACSQSPASSTASAPATTESTASLAIPPPPPGKATIQSTPEAWRAVFDSSFHTVGQSKDQGDGVTAFNACFDASEPAAQANCAVAATAERDAFRHLWIFTPSTSAKKELLQSSLSSYVSVPENHAPVVFLSPLYFSEDGWLFMTSMAIMVDGEVVLEKSFEHSDVHTHVGSGYVLESVDFVLSPEQITALRKIRPTSKVIIRYIGKNGFVSIDDSKAKQNAAKFLADLPVTLGIYDAIMAKVGGKDVLTP